MNIKLHAILIVSIIMLCASIVNGQSNLNILPFVVLGIYLSLRIITKKNVLWEAKFAAQFGTVLFIFLSNYDKLHFPNGVNSPELSLMLGGMMLIDLFFDNIGKK